MTKIHPAVAEHVMEENEKLREVLRCIADLPMDRCSTENDYRLSAAKAIARDALSQQAEPTDTYTAVDMSTAAAQGFRDGQAAVEPAPAQDEREAEAAVKALLFSGRLVDSFLIRDICKAVLSSAPIAQTAPQPGKVSAYRTLDRHGSAVTEWIDGDPAGGEPIVPGGSFQLAYSAPQPEQSGLVEAAGAVIRAADWWSANEDSPKSALAHFARATDALRAALSAQGESHE